MTPVPIPMEMTAERNGLVGMIGREARREAAAVVERKAVMVTSSGDPQKTKPRKSLRAAAWVV